MVKAKDQDVKKFGNDWFVFISGIRCWHNIQKAIDTINSEPPFSKKKSDNNDFKKDCYMFMEEKGMKLEFEQWLDKQVYKRQTFIKSNNHI